MLDTHIKIMASFYTALLITAVVSMLLFGGLEIKTPSVKGKAIEATMIDISQLKAFTKKKKPIKQVAPPIKQPKPPIKEKIKEPVKQPVKQPIKQPTIDTRARDLEREKQIKRNKLKEKLRKQKIAAKKRSEQAAQELKDLANNTKDETQEVVENIGNAKGKAEANELNQLMARYQLAIMSSVEHQWNKPASANKNLLCYVKVRQLPGGGVMDATISSPCNANSIVKKSIKDAILKADPLPYKGFEKVFSRTATFIFQPND